MAEEHEHTKVKEQDDTRAGEESCENIDDPVRRTLCKMCNKPVVGASPFCEEHEPPVP